MCDAGPGQKVPVTDVLRREIESRYLAYKENGGGWTLFQRLPKWPGTWGIAYNIHHNGQHRTDPSVYEALGIEVPRIWSGEVPSDPRLMDPDALADLVEQLPLRECAVTWCDRHFYKRVWNQKYCRTCRENGDARRWRHGTT